MHLPTRQDGVENCDKSYIYPIKESYQEHDANKGKNDTLFYTDREPQTGGTYLSSP